MIIKSESEQHSVETTRIQLEALEDQVAKFVKQNNLLQKEMLSMRNEMQSMQSSSPIDHVTKMVEVKSVLTQPSPKQLQTLTNGEKIASVGTETYEDTLEKISKLPAKSQVAPMSFLNMNRKMTFTQIMAALKNSSKASIIDSVANNNDNFTNEPKKIIPKREMIPSGSHPKQELSIKIKSNTAHLYDYVSSLQPEERLIAIRHLQQSNNKLTIEELKDFVENKTEPKINFINNFFNRNKTEASPEIPVGILEFISNLKSTISELTSEQELENGQGMRRLLNVANNLAVKNKFTNGKFAKITSDEFCEIALREYELKYNTGKYVKDSVMNAIKFFGVKIPLTDNNQESNVVIVEPPVIADQVIVQESVNNANINPAKVISKPKATTSEQLPNKFTADQRAAIINVCNQFISILNSKGLNSNTLGFQKLIKYSETATSASIIKSAFKQLERLTNDYSNTSNDRKKELLTKSNNEFLRILGELEKLPQTPYNLNGAKKKFPPLTDVRPANYRL